MLRRSSGLYRRLLWFAFLWSSGVMAVVVFAYALRALPFF